MRLYQVFHDLPQRQGNLAFVSGAGRDGAAAPEPRAMPAHCRISREQDDRFAVSCEQHGRRIQCCGHGLLAAAHDRLQHSDAARIELGEGIWAERDAGVADQAGTWLHLPPVVPRATDVPDWTRELVCTRSRTPITPIAAAATEPDDGYLLLQLATDIDLGASAVHIQLITRSTDRAVLIWQLSPDNPSQVRTRYFAPQYGNDEDRATGSVLRALAPHLHDATGGTRFDVIQCSPTGGRMTACSTDDSVAISGNIRLVDDRDLPTPWQV